MRGEDEAHAPSPSGPARAVRLEALEAELLTALVHAAAGDLPELARSERRCRDLAASFSAFPQGSATPAEGEALARVQGLYGRIGVALEEARGRLGARARVAQTESAALASYRASVARTATVGRLA